MGNTKKAKRAAAQPPTSFLSKFAADSVEYLNSIPGKPILFILCLVAANFQGHYFPLFWSYTARPALVGSRIFRRELLVNPAVSQQSRVDQNILRRSKMAMLERPPQDPVLPNKLETNVKDPQEHSVGKDSQGEQMSDSRKDRTMQLRADGDLRTPDDKSNQGQAGSSNDVEPRQDNSSPHEQASESASLSASSAGSHNRHGLDDGNDEPEGEGDSFTPYLNYHRISVMNTPVCASVLPAELLKNVNRKPIVDLPSLDEMGRRALVFMPRHGLGNSLRGYVSAYVFARLSGRTLVRFHGAEHTKVYDTLCTAFKCGFDSVHWDNQTGPMALYRALEALNPFPMYKSSSGIRESIQEDVPVMLSRSPSHFDGFWRNSPRLLSCVNTAFACSSTWCVHSRAIQGLLRGPTPALKEVVRHILRKHVPGKDGGEGKDIHAEEEEDENGKRKPMKGLVGMFDVALHMRTRTAAIESLEGGSAELSRVGCFETSKKKPEHQFLKTCLWDCLGGILKELEKSRRAFWESKRKAGINLPPPPRLSILLTTDNEALRPEFVKRLSELGDVYFSSGGIVHLSKSSSTDFERLPTMAEFFLMAKSHTIIEAGSYVSTFAYFAGLLGNGTLASIEWIRGGGCGLKLTHQGEIGRYFAEEKSAAA